jgi:hypothetical protein
VDEWGEPLYRINVDQPADPESIAVRIRETMPA